MTFRRNLLTAVVLAAGVLAGARAFAEMIGLADLNIGQHTPQFVELHVLAGPELEGVPGQVRFGPAPYSGGVIHVAPLHGGWNVIMVPNPHLGGWYTVQTPDGKAKTTEEDTDPLY